MTFLALLAMVGSAAHAAENSIDVGLHKDRHVFLTADERTAIRERAGTLEWAATVRERVVREADALVDGALDIPHAGGQWTHWYSCKKDGARLRAASATEHVCPACGEVYSGWPYDEVHITFQHTRWLNGIETLGVAYLLEEKPAYAERARDVLLEYASFYEDLEPHNTKGERGHTEARLFAQTLDEAVALCHVCVGYDFVRDAPCFTPRDRRQIEKHLLRPMTKTIMSNDMGVSNWQSWHNAAVGCVGYLCRDKGLVKWAVKGRSGFLFQMRRSVMSSGMWYEESPSYHWYALAAHVYLMEAAARSGTDLYRLPIVKKMFDAPVRQVMPDLTFPALHDSDRSSIAGARRFYDVAYRRFEDPAYIPLMRPRDSGWSLLWGVGEVPPDAGDGLQLVSSNEEAEGLAVLRDASGRSALYMDYGPGISGHNQPAKLGIILFAHGDERFVDPGRLPYGNPLHKQWYRQTVAHNTVVVNETSQTRTGAKLKAFGVNDRFSIVRAVCDGAYPGVVLDRTLLFYGDTIVDVFRCSAERESTFDLPLHVRGELACTAPTEPFEGFASDSGYQHLQEARSLTEPVREFGVDCGEGRRVLVRFLDGSKQYLANGYGKSPREILPMVVRRQRGRNATFMSVYQILGPDGRAGQVDVTDDGWVVFETGREDIRRAGLRVNDQTHVVEQDGDGRRAALFRALIGGLEEVAE